MTAPQHTPEEWRTADTVNGPQWAHVIIGGLGLRAIAQCDREGGDRPEDQANARRIVACVNALAGISTEALERHSGLWRKKFSEREALYVAGIKDPSALGDVMEFLRSLEHQPGRHYEGAWMDDRVNAARALLARLEGREQDSA